MITSVEGFTPNIKTIEAVVCDYYQVRPLYLHNRSRLIGVRWPRQVVITLAVRFARYTLSEAGAYFDRHNSTSAHTIRTVTREYVNDKKVRAVLDQIFDRLGFDGKRL